MKKYLQLTSLILIIAILSGCSTSVSETTQRRRRATTTTTVTTSAKESTIATTESTVAPTEPPKDYVLSPEGQVVLDDAIIDMENAIAIVEADLHDEESIYSLPYDDTRLFYGYLNDNQKAAYDLILEKATDFEPLFFDENLYSDEDWMMAFSAISQDQPRLVIYTGMDIQDDGTSLFYSLEDEYGNVTTDLEIIKDQMNTFDAISETIVSMIPSEFSTFDKYRVIAHFISNRLDYNYTVSDEVSRGDYTAFPAIYGGYTICGGYALGFAYLCRYANLWATVISGTTEGGYHAWNIVALEDDYYHVDVCWSDAFDANSEEWDTYFMMTNEKALESRTFEGAGVFSDGNT